MAMLIPGVSACPLCGRVLTKDDQIFATSGPYPMPPHLFGYCDAGMHWSCYGAWPHREEFAKALFEFEVERVRSECRWSEAYLDDRVLVTVAPFIGEGGHATLALAKTGTRVKVDMAGWERWLEAPQTTNVHTPDRLVPWPPSLWDFSCSKVRRLHQVEIETVREVIPALRTALPTAAAVVATLDVVDIWIGHFKSDSAFKQYFHEAYLEADNVPISDFARDQNQSFYDRRFLWHVYDERLDLKAVFGQNGFAMPSMREAAFAAASNHIESSNTILLAFHNAIRHPRSAHSGEYVLDYLGRFDCKRNG